jgi:hypothetical protein
MTADGSGVFFTSADKLATASDPDTDASPDLYEAEVDPEGDLTLSRLSAGEAPAGNTDACEPVSDSGGEHWNTVGAAKNCGIVAIGGGGGVASGDGSVYFLSPEKLTPTCACLSPGDPALNQPNLYLAAPGQPLRFITTLEPEDPLVLDAVKEAEVRHTADFQVTRDGRFAAFPSTSALASRGEETALHTVLYRYDAASQALICVSCTLSGIPSQGDSSLASEGLSLTDDGRVFFNSTDPLLPIDTDQKQDVYEWEPQGGGNCGSASPFFAKEQSACLGLISAGTSSFDSGLHSADSVGKDAYFFTNDSLAPQDENGPTVKIYDAREAGGFPYLFPETDCKASDECHGAASPPPPPIENGSKAGTPTNHPSESKACKKGFVRKHGTCVRKPKHHPKNHDKQAHHKRGARR